MPPFLRFTRRELVTGVVVFACVCWSAWYSYRRGWNDAMRVRGVQRVSPSTGPAEADETPER